VSPIPQLLSRVSVVAVIGASAGAATHHGTATPARPGIDVLLTDSSAMIRGRRVGLLTNIGAVDSHGVTDITRLQQAGVELVALFAPEHGLEAQLPPGAAVANDTLAVGHTPVYSLYGRTAAPTPAMLAGIDVLLVDLPEVGARYFTYLSTTINLMRAAGAQGIPVVILDRPDPIGGAMQGNILDTAYASNVGALAMPMRTGLTAGEAARLARADLGIDVDLRIVPADGWKRTEDLDQAGLPFRAPSPNLQDLDALFLYPGLCLFEGTALSVGRGTEHPFHMIGAPWLDTSAVLARMRAARLPGVQFRGMVFTPHQPGDGKFADSTVRGVELIVTDRRRFDAPAAAVYLLDAVRAVHPDRIAIGGSFDRLAGGPVLREQLLRGETPASIVAGWQAPLAAFRRRVTPFLLYR
jgi:uncharacterized protein YbbC (DUF1343 family)